MVGDVSADVAMAASDIVSGESGEDTTERGDGKLSLRMKLVTPVEEGSSERFILQSESHLNAAQRGTCVFLGVITWYPWRCCMLSSPF